jgi:two-component system, cell cycle response regulator DivK
MATVLLVEDNEESREGLSRHLKRKGYKTLIAVDGREAVYVACTEIPDIILMDMSLPILDGWEATLGTSPHTRVECSRDTLPNQAWSRRSNSSSGTLLSR